MYLSRVKMFLYLQPWPGLPTGVKFDPSDQELLKHLRAKVRKSNPHPFIDAFIPTLDSEDDISKIHPEKLPGIIAVWWVGIFCTRKPPQYIWLLLQLA